MSIDDEFRSMMLSSQVRDNEEVINSILAVEAQARHAMACDEDPEAANQFANAGHSMILELPLRSISSVVMGLADLYNREHEAYTHVLDSLHDIREHVRQYQVFVERGNAAMAAASVGAISSIVDQALEHALYEKVDDSE